MVFEKCSGRLERRHRQSYSSFVPQLECSTLPPHVSLQDEIDALATSRSASDTSGGAHEGVLTSLLNEMDGVQELVGVTIVAATNRPDVIVSIFQSTLPAVVHVPRRTRH